MKIEQLADFPALQQLARALWRDGTARGAAVLVGAGFSRNATRSGADTPPPPLWSTLAELMAAQLYPDVGDAPRDPLRLAEEFRTNLGQTALDEFVRTNIRDAAWEPGTQHQELLELPWSDVLTTNWDTLLERSKSTRRWEAVRSTADLAHGRERRIIKLHGTIGISEHFIFAEEDYRTYPSRFAAFVNTARQIFIENELCLLGFSGDDPNFLQWSGWVRDHLGESARRIYLVGVLDLRPTKRKFLESRNIAPIDLAPLVANGTRDERETAATAQFLDYLARAKPKAAYEWRPADHSAYDFTPKTMEDIQRQAKDDDYAASLLDQSARIWRKDRDGFPSWLVCPGSLRRAIYYSSNVARWRQPTALKKLDLKRRAEILHEIVWRCSTAFESLDPRLEELLASCANPAQPCGLEKSQQLEIAVALLRLARQSGNEEAFARWGGLIETHAESESDLHAEVIYQRCLRARDRLNLRELAIELNKLTGPDPVWRLRRAALHCELGEFSDASSLITKARDELLDRQRRDNNSLWVRSRLAWAEWLFRATQTDFSPRRPSPWASEFKQSLCDPDAQIEEIGDQASDALRDRQEKEVEAIPQFEAGHYKDPSRSTVITDGTAATALDTLKRLTEAVGVPPHLNHFDMLGRVKDDAALLVFEPTFDWYAWLLRTRHSSLDRVFDRYFCRVAVARLPADVAISLSDRMSEATAYWRERIRTLGSSSPPDRMCAIERLRLSVETLSRLTARQDAGRARAAFDLAMDMARDPLQHPWLIEPMNNLARYSIQAIAPSMRSELALAAIECPLSSEKGGVEGPWRWLNPVDSIFNAPPVRPEGDTRWAHRIGQLIDQVTTGAAGRQEAMLRLYYLSRHGALTGGEQTSLGTAIWSRRGVTAASLPAGTNLLAHTFLELPAPDGIDREALVRTYLFDANFTELLKQPQPLGTQEIAYKLNRLLELVAAADKSLYPTPVQAARLFSELTSWAATLGGDVGKADPLGASLRREYYVGANSYVGSVLARLVVPSLPREERSEDRAGSLLTFVRGPDAGSGLPAVPYFAHLPDVRIEAIRRIRRAVIAREFHEVAGSAAAIEVWATLYPPGDPAYLPEQILEQLISAIETRHGVGLHALIQCVCKLVELKLLRTDDGKRLDEALGDLIAETAYEKIDLDSKQATSVSLLRAACVQLAHSLQNSGAGGASADAWLTIADTDPLPEVRFALT